MNRRMVESGPATQRAAGPGAPQTNKNDINLSEKNRKDYQTSILNREQNTS